MKKLLFIFAVGAIACGCVDRSSKTSAENSEAEIQSTVSQTVAPDSVDIETRIAEFASAHPQLTLLGAACALGSIEMVDSLLGQGADYTNCYHDEVCHYDVMYVAVTYQHHRLASHLISHGYFAEPNKWYTPSGTLLCVACRQNDDKIAQILLEANADPNIILNDTCEAYYRYSPLEAAIYNENPELVKILLDYGANPNPAPAYDEEGNVIKGTFYSPLTDAVNNSDMELAKMLLQAGADPTITDPESGMNVLALAQANGDRQIIDLLKTPAQF